MVMSVSKRYASLAPYAVFALIVLSVGIGTRTFVVRSSAQEPMQPLDLSGYRMTFNEDFHNLDVSAWGPGTRWIAHTPWNGDFGDARFADPVPGFPFAVDDGRLRIEARRGDDWKWSAGLLASTDASGAGFSQQYGYFEMRAKYPPGPGIWGAFWLIGNKVPGGSAEIDVVEYYGQANNSYEAAVHIWPKEGLGTTYEAKSRIMADPDSLTSQSHDYGVLVEPDWITFYLDRMSRFKTQTPPEHKQKLFMLLNLALGGGWPIDKTPNPSFMYVDYVRAYAK